MNVAAVGDAGMAGEAAPERKSFAEVWLVTLGHSLTHWYPATFYLLLPLIGKELGLSYSEIGLVMSCQYLAGAIANIPGGIFVDLVPRKGWLMALSLFWVGFPYLIIGLTHSYWLLLACMCLVGIGNNLWHPTAIPTLARRFPERKGLVLSLHGMGGNVGDALAPLCIGALLTLLTWRQVVVVNLLPGVAMSVVLLVFLGRLQLGAKGGKSAEDGKQQTVGQYMRDLRVLAKNRPLILLSVSSAFRSMTQNALLTFLPVFLSYQLGYSAKWVGACMFGLQAAGFAASPVAGHLSDKMGRRRIIISSMAMTAVVLVFMGLAGNSPMFVFLIAFLGFFLYAVRPVLQAWLLDATPKHMGGISVGVLFGTQALGSSVGPIIGGILGDRYGLSATIYFVAASIVIANLFIFFVPAAGADADRAKR